MRNHHSIDTSHPRMDTTYLTKTQWLTISLIWKKKIMKRMQKNTSPQLHWMMMSRSKNQFQERHLYIHENSQHDLCPYPCLYSLNQLHLTQNDALQYMNLSDIFKFLNIITTARDKDIPSLEDILKL